MADLLVVSLTETTRQDDGYEIIAKNLEDNSWVIIPSMPESMMFNEEGKSQWDILAVTRADIKLRLFEQRSGIYDVVIDAFFPKMIKEPIIDNTKRIEILDELSTMNLNDITNSNEWVGLLKNPLISDIIFRKRKENEYSYNENKPFFWECRIDFNDTSGNGLRYGHNVGTVCKDLRFKSYWKDIKNKRGNLYGECKEKWIDYMMSNNTYFIIEYIPNKYYGSIGMISGIVCISN